MPEKIPYIGGPRDGEFDTSDTLGCQTRCGSRDGQPTFATYCRHEGKLVFLGYLFWGQPHIDVAMVAHGIPLPEKPKPKGPEDSPALRHRSKNYPERYAGRVPKRVRMTQTSRSDLPAFLLDRPEDELIAEAGKEYPVWVNSHGAVAAYLPCGEQLGLRPGEFEVVEWW